MGVCIKFFFIFFSKFFLCPSAEKFRRGTLQCVTSFGYRKTLRFRELCHYLVSKFFFSHIAKKLRQGTRLCFRNFRVSKNFMPERGKSWFSIEFFCLTVPKNFVGEPFFSQNFWCRKYLCLSCGVGGGRVSRFSVDFFISQCRKTS